MYKLCVFGGTTEGRELVEFLNTQPCRVTACVATEYGQTLLPEGENLTVVVADDGVGMSDDQRRDILQKESRMNHVGLRNVHERIQMCYGSAYGLSIESAVGQGTKITYTLPYREAKEEA